MFEMHGALLMFEMNSDLLMFEMHGALLLFEINGDLLMFEMHVSMHLRIFLET